MKIFLQISLIFFLCSSGTFYAQTLGTAFVRQTDLPDGVVTDLLVKSGDSLNFQVGAEGAVFELWATNFWGKDLTLIDTKIVNVYSPKATLDIQSQDPYSRGDPGSLSRTLRTRADRPFNVSLKVTGFTASDSNDLLFVDERTPFSLTTYQAADDPQAAMVTEIQMTNVTRNWEEYHNLSKAGEDPRYACGECSFSVFWKDPLLTSVGGGINLAKETIEIWPMTELKFQGLLPNEVYVDRIPTVTFEFQHLYPDSRTYVQIYQGPQKLGTSGTVVAGTERSFGSYYLPADVSTSAPQNYIVAIDDLSNYTPKDGIYTLEVITETPFERGGERLMQLTFEVDRVISTRGQLSTREATTPASAP